MSGRRRFAVVATPLLALLVVAAAILWPTGAAPAAAQSADPAVTCFEITAGWRICASSAPAPISAASPLPPTTLAYGAPTTSGSVTDDGDYAFLTDPDDLTTMVTTYEGLHDGLREGNPIGLVLHQNDGHGASHEAFYDLVQANDVFEWREADDCWMRYVIREVHTDPAGDPPRKPADGPDLLPPLPRHRLHRRPPHQREPHLHLDAGLVLDGEPPHQSLLARDLPLGARGMERHATGAGHRHADRHALAA